ncbi:tRNA (adenosine(37)-N6)-threonylcarbamoyltransferase complex ATPase subunit type 1 TsaE [uncultured Cocleimonas sp.]|uniref:tRNA (adenosine(37)-N6)-threonylcarbamoyltransferase complex ATPase subunit type 1 TsaE n=1 Tax=uncultured Cocleimonas sp. TaxID=1051587 RepID=UPI00261D3C37|nr:tRNA (adenosine(37)-N6)-threonylcarbamoyltransferase complex ATPase subunit type 1 TsaE [uncultured Cocleimonas sp.]
MTDKLIIHDENEMMSFGGRIAERFPKGGMVFLNGDLGAGKTTLVRGLLRSLDFQGTVKSPTYTLVEPYQIKGRMIYHFDLYRLADPEELEYIGGREYWNSDALCLVEWPEKALGFLPEPDLIIDILYRDTQREIITNPSISI